MLLAEGETVHLVTDADKKVRSVPEIYKRHILADQAGQAFPARTSTQLITFSEPSVSQT